MRSLRVLLGAAILAATLASPVEAATRFRDRVFLGPIVRASQVGGQTGTYRTQDGIPVEVTVSPNVPNGPGVAQEIVNFLGSRLHGLELGRLRVWIGTPEEVNQACGGGQGVLACYSVGERKMYVPSVDPGGGGPFTRDYAITHEYGHHIASFRSNYPFRAVNWGAKYWASYEFVCEGVDRGAFFPGDQGEHYLDDPGEAFADAYAHLHYPEVVWQFNQELRPDAGSFAAIRRDVLSPWQGSRRRIIRGVLSSRRRSRFTLVTATLDGMIDLRLSGPRTANFNLAIYDGGRRVAATRARGSRDRLTAIICRDRTPRASGRIRIQRVTGAGRYALTILSPG